MTKKELAAIVKRLGREVAELRAWRDGHACGPATACQPQPVPGPWEPPCTCGQTIPCQRHVVSLPTVWVGDPAQPSTYIGDPPYGGSWTYTGIPPSTTTVSVSGEPWRVMSSAFTYSFTPRQPLRQVWPPKNDPDDPDMGVPAIA